MGDFFDDVFDDDCEEEEWAEEEDARGGCYIATAVYGSYDCPPVWTLRHFRDRYLAKRILGRAFIKVYYAISPTLVKLFGHTKWFNKFFRKLLDPMVKSLRAKGY